MRLTTRPDHRTLRGAIATLVLAASLAACGEVEEGEPEGPPDGIDSVQSALSTISCKESTGTGYVSGKPFTITVVTVDGKPVQKNTANAYYVMAKAAAAKGVNLQVVSGFRTMAQQTTLYNCYKTCSCNNCNLAAKPGYSNHQSGHALDLNTSASGVYSWLTAHGAAYGFKKTVPSENWHWEWWSGGPGGGPCVTPGTLKGVVYASPSLSSPLGGATVKLSNGKTATTSSAGVFSFSVAPATYTITASKPGYVTASAKGTVAEGKSTTINLGLKAVAVAPDSGMRDAGAPASDSGAGDAAQPAADDGGEPQQPEGDGGEPEGPPEGLDQATTAGGCSVSSGSRGAQGSSSSSSLALLLVLALVLAFRRRAV
jgi:MYXO-CTERM domain-containing protein